MERGAGSSLAYSDKKTQTIRGFSAGAAAAADGRLSASGRAMQAQFEAGIAVFDLRTLIHQAMSGGAEKALSLLDKLVLLGGFLIAQEGRNGDGTQNAQNNNNDQQLYKREARTKAAWRR